MIAEASKSGVKLVGYVSTRYTGRSLADAKKDIDAWLGFYPQIAGFFIDQQSCEARHVGYYAELRTYAKGKLHDGLLIANPGSSCDKAYLAQRVSDVTCVFAYYEGFGAFDSPPPQGLSLLTVRRPGLQGRRRRDHGAMVKDAILKRIGYIYITDGGPFNQWNKLPGYWEAEVDAVYRVQ